MPANANLHLSLRGNSAGCRLSSADDTSLTCAGHNGAKTDIFQRSDIRKVVIPHRGRSALIGLGIGAAVGFIVGAASGDSCKPQDIICFSRGETGALGAVVFAPIGALVGALTDFSHSTIYRAP